MSDDNGAHDHDHDEEEIEGEVEITFQPREEALAELGVDLEAFESALLDALDAHEALAAESDDPDATPAFENIMLDLAGKKVRLGDIADVEVSAGFDALGLDEIDLDEEDDETDDEA
jgi:hypothetical protein